MSIYRRSGQTLRRLIAKICVFGDLNIFLSFFFAFENPFSTPVYLCSEASAGRLPVGASDEGAVLHPVQPTPSGGELHLGSHHSPVWTRQQTMHQSDTRSGVRRNKEVIENCSMRLIIFEVEIGFFNVVEECKNSFWLSSKKGSIIFLVKCNLKFLLAQSNTIVLHYPVILVACRFFCGWCCKTASRYTAGGR